MAPKTTLAGGCEVDDRVFSDTHQNPDRTPTPESDIQAFLAKVDTFHCQAFACTMRVEQCAINRDNGNYVCGKCTQERPALPGSAAPQIKRRGRKKADPPPGCQWIGRYLAGTCPSCKRPGVTLSNGKICSRCQGRIARGDDVMAPNRHAARLR
jgi:hypothetical protein